MKCEKYVTLFSDTFELGDCVYGVAVDSFLEHILAGNVGAAEMATVTMNGDFLKIFDNCCGYELYRDEADPSSIVQKRLDDTVVVNGSVCLKIGAKGNLIELEAARKELTDKFSPDAVRVFPMNSQSIFGMTGCPNFINLYSVGFNAVTSTFFTNPLHIFDLRHLDERVRFIKTVFKIAEWMSTVSRPCEGFHLFPGVRKKTPNGHHITWTKDCLLKELKLRQSDYGRTRSAGSVTATAELKTIMGRIGAIYTARLPNVEWGTVQEPNLLRVTRIGFMLKNAVLTDMISR